MQIHHLLLQSHQEQRRKEGRQGKWAKESTGVHSSQDLLQAITNPEEESHTVTVVVWILAGWLQPDRPSYTLFQSNICPFKVCKAYIKCGTAHSSNAPFHSHYSQNHTNRGTQLQNTTRRLVARQLKSWYLSIDRMLFFLILCCFKYFWVILISLTVKNFTNFTKWIFLMTVSNNSNWPLNFWLIQITEDLHLSIYGRLWLWSQCCATHKHIHTHNAGFERVVRPVGCTEPAKHNAKAFVLALALC